MKTQSKQQKQKKKRADCETICFARDEVALGLVVSTSRLQTNQRTWFETTVFLDGRPCDDVVPTRTVNAALRTHKDLVISARELLAG